MIKDRLIFFNAIPAKGAPLAVGTDISTIHSVSLANVPEDVAREAVEGRMI
jgi:hypothetical protein